MKAMTGWIVPDRNWALKLAWKSCSFSASKTSIASCWRPNAFTIECPVCISST